MKFRLLPNALSGRIVLILLTGVFLALTAGAVLHLHERSRALSAFGGLQTAQGFVAIVHLLDSLPPGERIKVASILETPLQYLRFLPVMPIRNEEGVHDPRAIRLGELLRGYLGDQRPLHVVVLSSPNHPFPNRGTAKKTPPGQEILWPPPQMNHYGHYWRHMGMMEPIMPLGISFLVRTQLVGGDWIEFQSHLPGKVFEWSEGMLVSLMLLFCLVGLLSLAAVRLATRPLLLLANAASNLGQDINHPPLDLSGPREVRHAASAFNAMQERLKRYVNERTHLLAAVSHDLKTPLTRMRLRVERITDVKLQEDLLRNLTEMERMTHSALEYAQGMEGMEPVCKVDILAMLESLQEEFADMNREVSIQCSNMPPFPIMPKSLKRCLVNLVDNAITYGELARIRADLLGDQLRISIADNGPGIPETQRERVFEPFTRLEGSRNRNTGGTGLGLPIARNIVRAHGGELTLRNRPDGGLEVILTIPAQRIHPNT